jgi:hypothetical protein
MTGAVRGLATEVSGSGMHGPVAGASTDSCMRESKEKTSRAKPLMLNPGNDLREAFEKSAGLREWKICRRRN